MKYVQKFINRVLYGNDIELIYHPQRRSQDCLAWEAVAGASGLALIQGTFQTRFLLKLGANIDQLSLMASLTMVASISCLFGGLLFDKRAKKKPLVIKLLMTARLCMAALFFLPFVIGVNQLMVNIFMITTLLAQATTTLADSGYNSLMAAVIPPNVRGRVMAVRYILNYFLTPILPLLGAIYLDHAGDTLIPFAVLAGVSALLICLEMFLLSRVEEPEYPAVVKEKEKISGKERLIRFRGQMHEARGYLNLLGECFLFYLFLYICGSFTPTYLNSTDYIGVSAVFLQVAEIVLCIMKIVFSRFIGRLCDRIGPAKMLFLTQFVFGVEMLTWVIVPPSWLPWAIFIPYLFQALSNSLSAISVFARKFELMPKENESTFFGLFSAATALACFIGPAIGRALLHFFEKNLSETMLADFWQLRLIYLIAGGLILLQKAVNLLIRHKCEV